MLVKLGAQLLVCLVLVAGCAPAGYKTVKAGPAPAPETAPVPEVGAAGQPGGPSFAFQLWQTGGLPLRSLKDIPPQRYVEEVELKYEKDKSKRYAEKKFPPSPSLLDVVGMGLSLGLAPALGAPATSGNIARVAVGPGLMMVGGSGRSVSAWERGMVLARIKPWMPAQEAATPQEAAAKFRQMLEQALRGLDMGTSVVLDIPLPHLEHPPAVVAGALRTNKEAWTWGRTNSILVTASGLVPKQYKALAIHDDVANWKQISSRLPRWCFIALSDSLTSNGKHFVGYPQVLWQGKAYYFGQP